MAPSSHFANVSDEEIREIKVNAVPKSTQNGMKYGVRLFKSKSTSSASHILFLKLINCHRSITKAELAV